MELKEILSAVLTKHGQLLEDGYCEDAINELEKELRQNFPFEIAEEIVKARMVEELEKLKLAGRDDPFMSLTASASKYYPTIPGWTVYRDGVCKDSKTGHQLLTVIASIPPIKTPAEIKAEIRAKLVAQLAEMDHAEAVEAGLRNIQPEA